MFRSTNFSSAAKMVAVLHPCLRVPVGLQALPASPDLREGIAAVAFFPLGYNEVFMKEG